MYKYLLQSVDGIQSFCILTMVLFFSVLFIAAISAFLGNKEEMNRMAEMPLRDE